MCIFLAVLGLHCCVQVFSRCGRRGLEAYTGFSLWWSVGSKWGGSVTVAQRLSCPTACGIFLDQESSLCPLYWQLDSSPVDHQGSPAGFKGERGGGENLIESSRQEVGSCILLHRVTDSSKCYLSCGVHLLDCLGVLLGSREPASHFVNCIILHFSFYLGKESVG